MKTDIQLVVFDLGKVLISHWDHWFEPFKHLGMDMPPALSNPPSMQAIYQLGNQLETGKIKPDDYYQHIANITGLSVPQTQTVLQAWLKEPLPGAIDLVHDLATHGQAKTACLSNINQIHWELICNDPQHQLPLDQLDYRFASYQIGHAKPDEAIYEHLEYQTGVSESAILFFDDRADNIATASRRGWRAIQVESPQHATVQIRQVLRECSIL